MFSIQSSTVGAQDCDDMFGGSVFGDACRGVDQGARDLGDDARDIAGTSLSVVAPGIVRGIQDELNDRANSNNARYLSQDEVTMLLQIFNDEYLDVFLDIELYFNVAPTTRWEVPALNTTLRFGIDAIAMTVDNQIFLDCFDPCYTSTVRWWALLAHEATHVLQYHTIGFDTFSENYVYQLVNNGYENAPIEVQAEEFEQQMRNEIGPSYLNSDLRNNGDRYVVTCIRNTRDSDFIMSYRWGDSNDFRDVTIEAGRIHRFWFDLDYIGATRARVFQVRFDNSFTDGYQPYSEELNRYSMRDSDSCPSQVYEVRATNNRLYLERTSRDVDPPPTTSSSSSSTTSTVTQAIQDLSIPGGFDSSANGIMRYRVYLVAGTTYSFSAHSSDFDTTLALVFETTGAQVAFDDDGGDGVNSLLEFTPATTGSYILTVDAFGGSSPSGELALSAREATSSSSAGSNATDCPGVISTPLDVGSRAQVSLDQQNSNNVRANPSASAPRTRYAPPGQEMEIIGGPVCADGYRWWQIELPSGNVGWTVDGNSDELWIVPID